jgi:hypothetical protein
MRFLQKEKKPKVEDRYKNNTSHAVKPHSSIILLYAL